MPVTPEIAAAIAAKYPPLAAQAAGAEPGALTVQHDTVSDGEGGVTYRQVGRYRKYRLPGGAIVALEEPESSEVFTARTESTSKSPSPEPVTAAFEASHEEVKTKAFVEEAKAKVKQVR